MSTEAGQILDNANIPSAPVETQPTPAPKEEPVSSKLQVLMERERQALNRERMAKTQEEKLREQLKKIEEFQSVKSDPKKALDMLGLSYDQLTQSILKDGEVPPSVEIQKLREELEQYKAQMQERSEKEAEEKKNQILQAESKAVSDFKLEINDYLKNNQARYDLIDFEQAHDLVYDVIDEHYNRTIDPETGVGKVMSIADAADKVEQHLEQKYLKAKERSKVKAFWGSLPKEVQKKLEKQELSQPPKTLTNNLSPQVQKKPSRPPEDQRIQAIVNEHVAKMRAQYA